MTECNAIIIAIDNVLTKKTNSISTTVTNTASVKYHSKRLLYFAYCCWQLLLFAIIMQNKNAQCKIGKYRIKKSSY